MINFFKDLFGCSLKSKVMKVINQKIVEYQKIHDDEVSECVKNYKSTIRVLRIGHKKAKQEIAEKHVNNILSKII